jgi:hypothetical protein
MNIRIICAVALVAVLALAGCGSLGHGAAATPKPAPAVTHTVTAGPSLPSAGPTVTKTATVTPAAPAGIQAVTPWSVVSEYYGDIESGDYADAYALLSSGGVTGQTYQQFAAGFGCTSYEDLAELGASGDTVSVSLDAAQCDGTVNQYQGTYTVQNGKITAADIRQTG